MSYPFYLTVKNKVCVFYSGHNLEYLIQLRLIKKLLEKEFLEIEFTFACVKDYMEYLEGEKVIDVKEPRAGFAFNYEIIYDASHKKHPILKMLQESKINIQKVSVGQSKGNIAYISAIGDFPNKTLTQEQIKKAVVFANNKGFKAEMIENRLSASNIKKLVSCAAYVIGTSNEILYEAIVSGIPTALIPSNVESEEIYKAFLPEKSCIVLK